MRAFFKDNDKIIINSMDYSEALVGQQFLKDLSNKTLSVEGRNDINDEFDGFVFKITDIVIPPVIPTYINTKFNITQNDATKLHADVVLDITDIPQDDLILIDYDATKINALSKYLESLGCTDVFFNPLAGLNATTNGNTIKATYIIPSGTFTFHKVQSQEVIQNNEFTVEFTEVTVDEG